MNKKAWMISVGSALGVASLGACGVLLWNSKQARMMRAAKRTGKILYKMGAV